MGRLFFCGDGGGLLTHGNHLVSSGKVLQDVANERDRFSAPSHMLIAGKKARSGSSSAPKKSSGCNNNEGLIPVTRQSRHRQAPVGPGRNTGKLPKK